MAEDEFNETLRLNPAFSEAYKNIGTVYLRRNNYEIAEKFYYKAIDLDPENPLNYLALGILYHNYIKDFKKACDNYQKYLDYGGTDRIKVNNWIKECGGTPRSD